LVGERPYRKAVSPKKGLSILNQMAADGKLDADVVAHLTAIMK